jgi:RNA polymerase sigma-70 factor (ECF subfamily)
MNEDKHAESGDRPNGKPFNEALLKHFIEEDSVVRAYVRSVTRGHRETDDVIQDVWRVACMKISEYDPNRPFRRWVMGITRLQLLKWRQHLARSREVLAPDVIDLLADTAETHYEELDMRSHYLRDCLKLLPSHSRVVMQMKYFLDMKIEDIAREVKKTTAAVEMILVRARRSLRACIEGKLQAEGGVTV